MMLSFETAGTPNLVRQAKSAKNEYYAAMLFCPLRIRCPLDNLFFELARMAVCPLVPSIENFLS